MKHLEVKTIWNLVTGDLTDKAEIATVEHLQICQKCQQEHEIISLIHQENYRDTAEHPSLRFSKSVMEKIESDLQVDNAVKYWMGFTKYAIWSALCVAILSVLIIAGSDSMSIINEMDYLSSLMFILIFTCIASWIFFIIDRILFRIYANR